MSKVVPFPPSPERSSADTDPRTEKIADAIKTLLSALTPDEQRCVLAQLTMAVEPIPAPNAGEVLGTIVRWMPRDSEWTVDDAKQAVAAEGVSATPKEVYNAIGYLTRKRHIQRIGYGRYLIDGAELRTLDDLGGAPSPDDCEP